MQRRVLEQKKGIRGNTAEIQVRSVVHLAHLPQC